MTSLHKSIALCGIWLGVGLTGIFDHLGGTPIVAFFALITSVMVLGSSE